MGKIFEVTENIEKLFEAGSLTFLLYNYCFILNPFLPCMSLGLKMAFRGGTSRMTLEQQVTLYIKNSKALQQIMHYNLYSFLEHSIDV